MLARPLALLVLVAACGDAAPPRPATGRAALPPLVATAAGPDDVVVATVDDRPVWGSCVAAQAAAGARSRQDALAQCLALELAAQEAERRGLGADPELLAERRRVLAAALVDREVTRKVTTPADLPAALVDEVWRRNQWRAVRQEYRGSFFARIELEDPAGTPADRAAEAAIRAAHATLAGRADLFPPDVEAAVRAAAAPDQEVSTGTPEAATYGEGSRLQAYYHEPLFAIGGIGQVAPPVRGPYGWDLILYTSRLEPWTRSRDQILAELFPAMRLRWFQQWTQQLARSHGARVLVDDATLREALGVETEDGDAAGAGGDGEGARPGPAPAPGGGAP